MNGSNRSAMVGGFLPLPPGKNAFPWQEESSRVLQKALTPIQSGGKGFTDVIATAATGTGKGTLLAGIAVKAARIGKKVLVLFHRRELLYDMASRIRSVDGSIKVGMLGDGHAQYAGTVQIVCALFQSLGGIVDNFIKIFGQVDLLITDECHLALSPSYLTIFAALRAHQGFRHIGLSATPWKNLPDRQKGGLKDVFQAIVFEYGLEDAICDGVLSPIDFRRVHTQRDNPLKLKTRQGADGESDYSDSDLKFLDEPEANQAILDAWRQHADRRLSMGFAVSVSHAKRLADIFCGAGIKAYAVWSGMDDAQRQNILRWLVKGDRNKVDIVFSKDLLTTGVDAPSVSCVLLSRPTASLGLVAQMIGRGTRRAPGKDDLRVLDFYDSIIEVTSDGEERVRREAFSTDGIEEKKQAEPETRMEPGNWIHMDNRPEQAGRICEIKKRGHVLTALVRWTDLSESWHPVRRLRKEREEDPEEEVQAPKAEGTRAATVNVGLRSYSVLVLDGTDPCGWFVQAGSCTMSATIPDGPRMIIQLILAQDIWEIWRVYAAGPAPEAWKVSKIGREATRSEALKIGRRAFVDANLHPYPMGARWKGEAATDAQRKLLRQLLLDDATNMSRGEAASLIESSIANRQIAAISGSHHG